MDNLLSWRIKKRGMIYIEIVFGALIAILFVGVYFNISSLLKIELKEVPEGDNNKKSIGIVLNILGGGGGRVVVILSGICPHGNGSWNYHTNCSFNRYFIDRCEKQKKS